MVDNKSKKRPLGFRTTAKEVEETFDTTRSELSRQKAGWKKAGEVADKAVRKVEKKIDQLLEDDPTDELGLIALRSDWYFWALDHLICRLGEDIASTHERLAKVEKELQNIKLGLG